MVGPLFPALPAGLEAGRRGIWDGGVPEAKGEAEEVAGDVV